MLTHSNGDDAELVLFIEPIVVLQVLKRGNERSSGSTYSYKALWLRPLETVTNETDTIISHLKAHDLV